MKPPEAIELTGRKAGPGTSVEIWIVVIIGAKSLTTFDVGNVTSFGDLILLDIGPNPWPDRQSFNSGNITTADYVEIDHCLDLSLLENVRYLKISKAYRCFWLFKNIKSIGNYTLTNLSDPETLARLLNGRGVGWVETPSFRINESMIIDSLRLYSNSLGYSSDEIVPQITTVGTDFNITSNTNVNLTFDFLTDVGASLFIHNNTDSQFKFEKISTVGSILLIDNINTTIPWFPALTIANDIHIRGNIDTSIGPNIFPALQSVTGTVVIEAWNDDFDCSKLVQYRDNHMIHHLSCNGTNNGTTGVANNAIDTIHESNPVLSPGGWAGVGVGIGGFVVGLLVSLIWLYVHLKRQIRNLAQPRPQTLNGKETTEGHVEPPQVFQIQEADGAGIIREKPDDPLIELPAKPAELPISP
ncbi:hypothetical protein GQX73_g9521 [Xylaria multiplex]|uniref:Receptor L-domain domain-containing protein n=1 Tax=Xylaria multiplex TaxID=323545 RepID=A0A7C8MMD6_9PEZI|nr:hypothetical protein GQX73_g9521 [Xylaria multiplex]